MEKEFKMKLSSLNCIIVGILGFFCFSFAFAFFRFFNFIFILFFSDFIEYLNYFLIFSVLLIIFIVFSLIKNKLIPHLNKENKIIFYDDKMEFLEDKKVETPNGTLFSPEKKYIKYEQIIRVEENYDEKNIILFLSEFDNSNEKIFSKKDFQNEEEYFEFVDILKRKTR